MAAAKPEIIQEPSEDPLADLFGSPEKQEEEVVEEEPTPDEPEEVNILSQLDQESDPLSTFNIKKVNETMEQEDHE